MSRKGDTSPCCPDAMASGSERNNLCADTDDILKCAKYDLSRFRNLVFGGFNVRYLPREGNTAHDRPTTFREETNYWKYLGVDAVQRMIECMGIG